MSQKNTALPKPLLAPLSAIQRLLDHFKGQGVIIGGIAASLLGTPRLTADVDALILLSIDDRTFRASSKAIPIWTANEFKIGSRNLPPCWKCPNSGKISPGGFSQKIRVNLLSRNRPCRWRENTSQKGAPDHEVSCHCS
ncbi:MAG: hypothetical protein AB1649_25620 [Chloroflexota bacterium]